MAYMLEMAPPRGQSGQNTTELISDARPEVEKKKKIILRLISKKEKKSHDVNLKCYFGRIIA